MKTKLSGVCEIGTHVHCSLADCTCACHRAIASDADQPEYSGKTLGDVELFVNGPPKITRIVAMDGMRTVGAAQLVPTDFKHGDRVTLTFRLDPPI